MGCASSTPMIATTGSEMLKSATHMAEGATKTTSEAVQEAAEMLSKTVEGAKETVGSAVTGIAHDLETVYIEKTEALDEAKNSLLQTLHLGGGAAPNNDMTAKSGGANEGASQHDAANLSRAPTPAVVGVDAPHPDSDSLKTSTSEPEIENVLAKYNEEKPPTPKPTLAELEQLDWVDGGKSAATAETLVSAAAARGTVDHRRPNTTEWEKHADLLTRARKVRPQELYRGRGGRSVDVVRRFGQEVHALAANTAPVPLAPTVAWSLQHESVSPFGNGALPQSSHKSRVALRYTREDDNSSWSDMNYNSESSSASAKTPSNLSSIRGSRGRVRLPYVLPKKNTRKQRRELTLPASGREGGCVSGIKWRGGGTVIAPDMGLGRNSNRLRLASPEKGHSLIRFTPHASLVMTPPPLRKRHVFQPRIDLVSSTSPPPTPFPYNDSKARTYKQFLARSSNSSPIRTRAILQHKVDVGTTALAATAVPVRHRSGVAVMPISEPQSQPSSRSSTNTSIVIVQSGQSTPVGDISSACSPAGSKGTRTSSRIANSPHQPAAPVNPLAAATNGITTNASTSARQPPPASLPSQNGDVSPSLALLFENSSSPRPPYSMPPPGHLSSSRSSHYKSLSPNNQGVASDGRRSVSPSPHFSSTYNIWPTFGELACKSDADNNASKSPFVTDLSSVSDRRALMSPYKLRDRCAVCLNKYVIK